MWIIVGDARFEPVSLPKLATTSPDIFGLWKDGGRCNVAAVEEDPADVAVEPAAVGEEPAAAGLQPTRRPGLQLSRYVCRKIAR